MSDSSASIVLFDGVCNLCNGFVQFIISHDPAGRFRFTALQSEAGQALLAQHGQLPAATPETVMLLENEQLYTHSTAALRITKGLSWPWRGLAVALVLPRFLRDAAYRFVARNRYRWFGRQESCWLPTPELKARFL